jgi:hypothetical protein
MMVGDGPEKAEYLCQEWGCGQVIFFGNSNEIDKILCLTDLFYFLQKRKFWFSRS